MRQPMHDTRSTVLRINNMVLTATGLPPETHDSFMQLVTAVILLAATVVFVVLMFRQLKETRVSKDGLGMMFLWLGLAVIGFSSLNYVIAGSGFGQVIAKTTNVGAPNSDIVFGFGLVIVVLGGIAALVLREQKDGGTKPKRAAKLSRSERRVAKKAASTPAARPTIVEQRQAREQAENLQTVGGGAFSTLGRQD
jgi:hypothetical protein